MTRALSALTALVLFHTVASAEAIDAAGAPSLSLDEALRLAEAKSPLVRRALKERGVAEAGRVGARALLPANPVLNITSGYRQDRSGSTPPSRGPEVTGRLEQMIEIGGQRGLRMAEAERAVDVAALRVDLAQVETRARVRAAYLGGLIARRRLEHAREQEQLGERVFTSARAREQAGAGTAVDLNLAEVERGRLQQERAAATIAVAESDDRLRRALGMKGRGPLQLTTTLALPPQVPEAVDPLLERARQRRAELRVLDAQGTQLDAQIARLRRERVPSPTLYFDVMSQQPGQLYLGGGIALPITLWRRNQGELAIARAQRELVAEDRAIFDEQLELEVELAHRVARGLREAAERWQTVALPAAEQNLELVTQGWRSGKFDLFRVVQTAREAADARRRGLELVGSLWDATITLERVTGGTL